MRNALITVIFILILGSLPTMAQTSTPTPSPSPTPGPSWCLTFNFTANDGGWSAGTFYAGFMLPYWDSAGWHDDYYEDSNNNDKRDLLIQRTITSGATMTNMTVTYNYTQGSGSNQVTTGNYFAFGDGGGNFLTYTWSQMTSRQGTAQTITWTGTRSLSTILQVWFRPIWLSNTVPSSPSPSGSALITQITMSGTGTNPFPDVTNTCGSTPTPSPTPTYTPTSTPVPITYTKPVSSQDLYPAGQLFNYPIVAVPYLEPSIEPINQSNQVTAFTQIPSAPVFPPKSTIVLSIEDVKSSSDCGFSVTGYNPTQCWAVYPSAYSDLDNTIWFNTPGGDALGIMGGLFNPGWQKITLRDADNILISYEYLVQNVNVVVGQEIDSTCYMATTIASPSLVSELQLSIPTAISLGFDFEYSTGFTGVIVSESGDEIESLDYFTIEPTVGAPPCSTPPQYEDCLFNPVLNNSSEWDFKNVQWGTDRATINSGGYVQKQVQLDLSSNPTTYVFAQGVGGDTFGYIKMLPMDGTNTFENVDYSPNFLQRSLGITAQTGVTLVTIYVSNDGDVPLEVRSICVQGGTSEDIPPPIEQPDEIFSPTQCTFQNASIASPAYWSVSDGIYKDGEFRLESGGIVAQTLSLTAGDYYLTVFSYLNYKATYVLDKESTDTFDIEFNVGDGWLPLATITEADFIAERNFMERSVMFTLADDYSGLVQIRATATGFGSEFDLGILSACLSATEFDSTGTSPFPQICGTPINNPPGESLSIWTQWLWANQWDFYNCKLMVLLNSMYKLGLQWYETFGWTIRYSQYAMKALYLWFSSDLFPWLNGQFYNIATGRTTTISSGGCDNAWCFLESLINGVLSPVIAIVQSLIDLIGGVLNFFLDVLGGLIDVVFNFINFLIDSLSNVWSIFATFINLWNSTSPASLPYLPTCNVNPQANGMCVALWMLENTVFSGTGSIFIPLIVSWGSLMALIWGGKRLKKAVMEAGNLI